jgi:hypothetical protein
MEVFMKKIGRSFKVLSFFTVAAGIIAPLSQANNPTFYIGGGLTLVI